jgi:homogentisate 1,2-dioxygenase
MLQGFDKDWLPIGKEGSTTYSNLPPGKFVFLVKASNSDGVWNIDPVEFAFEITPPFWKRPWFYIIATIIGISLIYGFIKVREQNLQRSRKRLKDEVTIRTKELSEEK